MLIDIKLDHAAKRGAIEVRIVEKGKPQKMGIDRKEAAMKLCQAVVDFQKWGDLPNRLIVWDFTERVIRHVFRVFESLR